MADAPSLRARIAARVGPLQFDLELDTGPGTLVVIGPNGAGKSSLLALLLGVLCVQRGRVTAGSAVLLDTGAGIDVPVEHRRLGYVPQDYGLFPHLSVRENVAFGRASARRVDELLHALGLHPLAGRRPRALSGGEKQRVALARALAISPRALLLDEPLAALDVSARREVRAFLAAYLDELALPAIVVTHDAADARAFGRRIAVLEAGRIAQTGTWDELARAPASRFVEEFVLQASDRSRAG